MPKRRGAFKALYCACACESPYRDVVEEAADNGADPENNHKGNPELGLLWRGQDNGRHDVADGADQAHHGHGLDHDEQGGKEKERVPLHVREHYQKRKGWDAGGKRKKKRKKKTK